MDEGFLDTYTVMRTKIQQTSTLMAPVYGRMVGSASGGGWENYCRIGVHMHIKFCLNNFINIADFL
jgi:hypothetical protein